MPPSKRQPSVFVIKCIWRGTSKTVRVPAYSEEVALRKAARAKENAGCWDMQVIKEIPGGVKS